MTRLIKRGLLLLVLGLVLLLAPNYIGEQGYVFISFLGWTVEGSVVQFIVLSVLLGFAIAILGYGIKYLIYMVIVPSKWWRSRHAKAHANYFQAGIDFMTLAMWRQAAEQFVKVKSVSKYNTAQELALVCAIRAEDPELLTQIKKQTKTVGELPPLTRLTNLVQQGNYQQAAAELKQLDLNLLKLALPMKQLWLDIQIQTFNWSAITKQLVKLDKQLAKQQNLEAGGSGESGPYDEWQNFLTDRLNHSFSQFVKQHSVSQLVQIWTNWPKALQQIPAVLGAYISVLSRAKQLEQIETLLLNNWRQHKQTWLVDNLRICYRETKRVHMDKLFGQIQKAATHSSDNKVLLTAYAYLAAGQKDNQLAKQALEQVIYSNKNQQDYILYANVLAELGEVRHSVEVYQELN